jgi:hypothetical protein
MTYVRVDEHANVLELKFDGEAAAPSAPIAELGDSEEALEKARYELTARRNALKYGHSVDYQG